MKRFAVIAVAAMLFITGLGAHAQAPEDVAKVEAALPAKATVQPAAPRRLLVFTLCKGFVHSSIPLGAKALTAMGEKTGAYSATVSDDLAQFTVENLKQYDAVCMLSTTGEVIEDPKIKQALVEFVKAGKGLVGIHAATDCCYKWAEYGEMMGGYFDGHPWGSGDTVTVKLDDPAHPLLSAFKGRGFDIKDEIYQFRPEPYSRKKLHELMSLDTTKTDMSKGGIKRTDGDFAIAWVHTFGQGRVFYCSLGHNESTYWNAPVLQHYLDGIQFALGDLKADATPTDALAPDYVEKSKTAGAQMLIDGLFTDVAKYETGKDPQAPTQLSELIITSYGDAAKRADYEKRLLAMLDANPTDDGRQFAVKHLAMIATDASLPALAKLLANPDAADDARYVLERMPSPEAGATLRDALATSEGAALFGIVNSLGERREAEAVEMLAPLARKDNKTLASAAAMALGKIGGEVAEKALLTLLNTAQPSQYDELLAAVLCAADARVARGEAPQAVAIYSALAANDSPARGHVAGLQGLAVVDGAQAIGKIIEALGNPDMKVQRGAVAAVRLVKTADAAQQLGAALEKIPASAQPLLIIALGDRGDAAALPAVSNAVKSSDPAVTLAAITALGALGNASSVEQLANLAAKGDAAFQGPARDSLARMHGDDVDSAIASAMEKAEPAVKSELIRALGARYSRNALPALLTAAKDSDETVRMQAYIALGALAGPEQLKDVVDLIAMEKSDTARAEAEKATIAVLGRGNDPAQNAATVLSALPDVQNGIPAYCAILRVLGKINDQTALDALISATQFKNGDVRLTAARGIAEWPTPAPAAQLLTMANEAPEAPLRDITLRGYLRMLEMPDNTGDILQQYDTVLKSCKSADERKLVLASVGNQHDPKLLALVTPLLEDPEVKQEAATAAEKLKQVSLSVSASAGNGDAKLAIDGDPATRWTTGEPMKKGQWFAIDIGYVATLGKVTLDCTGSNGDYPREYAVYLSQDAKDWGQPVAAGKGSGPVVSISLDGKRARHIKIEQLGSADGLFWSIHELKVELK